MLALTLASASEGVGWGSTQRWPFGQNRGFPPSRRAPSGSPPSSLLLRRRHQKVNKPSCACRPKGRQGNYLILIGGFKVIRGVFHAQRMIGKMRRRVLCTGTKHLIETRRRNGKRPPSSALTFAVGRRILATIRRIYVFSAWLQEPVADFVCGCAFYFLLASALLVGIKVLLSHMTPRVGQPLNDSIHTYAL